MPVVYLTVVKLELLRKVFNGKRPSSQRCKSW